MRSPVTQYDEELLSNARKLVDALERDKTLSSALGDYDLDAKALERGRFLVDETARALAWEREGRAYNYLSATPEGRVKEARYWNKDARRRHRQRCLRAAEASGSLWSFLGHVLDAFSVRVSRRLSRELRREIQRAKEGRPADAPLPKDTALVELSGWYGRWSLAALQSMRDKPEALALLGLVPGKAPPRRLRNRKDALGQAGAQRHLNVVPGSAG
jgi:hypothetical protein